MANCLTLNLDIAYQNNLTPYIKSSMEAELQTLLGKISLKINIAKPKAQRLDKSNSQEILEKQQQLNANFLADKGVQHLQEIFQSKFITTSIKGVNDV